MFSRNLGVSKGFEVWKHKKRVIVFNDSNTVKGFCNGNGVEQYNLIYNSSWPNAHSSNKIYVKNGDVVEYSIKFSPSNCRVRHFDNESIAYKSVAPTSKDGEITITQDGFIVFMNITGELTGTVTVIKE